jgi:hypothetical protein
LLQNNYFLLPEMSMTIGAQLCQPGTPSCWFFCTRPFRKSISSINVCPTITFHLWSRENLMLFNFSNFTSH